jgi:hypothetical protein
MRLDGLPGYPSSRIAFGSAVPEAINLQQAQAVP